MLRDLALLGRQMMMGFFDHHLARQPAALFPRGVDADGGLRADIFRAATIDLLHPSIPQRLVDRDPLGGVGVQHLQQEDLDHRLVEEREHRAARRVFLGGDDAVRVGGVEPVPARQELGIVSVRVVPVGRRPGAALVHHAHEDDGTRPDVQRARIVCTCTSGG